VTLANCGGSSGVYTGTLSTTLTFNAKSSPTTLDGTYTQLVNGTLTRTGAGAGTYGFSNATSNVSVTATLDANGVATAYSVRTTFSGSITVSGQAYNLAPESHSDQFPFQN
jgi:hypothetical protein